MSKNQYLPEDPYRRKKQIERWKRRMRKRLFLIMKWGVGVAVFVGLFCFICSQLRDRSTTESMHDAVFVYSQMEVVADAAEEQSATVPENQEGDDIDLKYDSSKTLPEGIIYPEELLELLEKNPETYEFVKNYPKKYGTVNREPLTEYANCNQMPLLMQWDERWGYYPYGDGVMGLTGCGPTCLSMVAIYLLGATELTPAWMADYSIQNGYCVPGHGTDWSLMEEGAEALGLLAEELPLNETTIAYHLQSGNPIICIMGPGDFTDNGHFIVLTDWEDGMVTINDPNSRANSAKQWRFEDIKYQIRNLWVYQA